MTNFIKKIHLAITLLLIPSISYGYGDADNVSECEESENCSLCETEGCGRGFISAEVLYWRAFESGLDTCISVRVSDTINSNDIVVSRSSGKGREPHFKWNPGFRLGAGYEFACNGWDIAAIWTHFHSHSHDSRNFGGTLRWNLDFDVIDIVAGYNYDIGPCFILRPFVGIRGAKIDQHLRSDFFRSISLSSDDDLFESDKKNKENFEGIGPLIGLEADWDIGCNFSLYASGSVSWLYGNFHITRHEYDKFVHAISSCKERKHLDASLAAADAAVGIRWQTCFCTDMQLILQLGLEHHRYFDYNRLGDYGDLSFDGVNFSAGIGF